MEKILEEKQLKNKDTLTHDCKNKEKQYSEIQKNQITGLRKKENKDLIMERRKQFSQMNKKSSSTIIEENKKSKVKEDIQNIPLVNSFTYSIESKS